MLEHLLPVVAAVSGGRPNGCEGLDVGRACAAAAADHGGAEGEPLGCECSIGAGVEVVSKADEAISWL
ncbi:hypothetical protein BH23CHL5_BH23CHL5_28540 [soil metagenome]